MNQFMDSTMTAVQHAKVLVTGGFGYIGSHAVLALLDAGASPVVLDDLSNGDERLAQPGVPFYYGDCGDRRLLDRILLEQDIVAIMHFAGKIIVTESISQPAPYYVANTGASQSLLWFATERKLPIVFSSTAAVYGVPEAPGPILETARLDPISPYGRSKLATEWMIRDFHRAYGLCYAILRYFNVVGADIHGRSGQIGKQVTHLVKAASQAALGLQKLTVFGNDYPTRDGTCERDYVHVTDLAAAHVLAVAHLLGGRAKELTLNCGYGRGYTVLEVIAAYETVLGRKLGFDFGPRRPADPPSLVGETDLLKKTLDWRPEYPELPSAISSALGWEKRLTNQ